MHNQKQTAVQIRNYESQLANFDAKFEQFEQRTEQMIEKKITQKLNHETLKLKNEISEEVNDLMKEQQEREKRESNLLIFNLPESTATEKEAYVTEELEKFKEICHEIETTCDGVSKLFRIGKKNEGKIRPLKVCFNTKKEATSIRLAAYKLKKL